MKRSYNNLLMQQTERDRFVDGTDGRMTKCFGRKMDGRIRILKKSHPDDRICCVRNLVPWTDCIGRNMDGRIRLLKKSDPPIIPPGNPMPLTESFGGKMYGKTRVLRKLTTDNRINTAGNPRLLRIKSRSIKK